MASEMDPRRRSSDAALHKVEELAVAVGTGQVPIDQALEMFMTTAAKGHQPTEAWGRLHAAALQHDKLADLAFAYEHAASDRRIKLFAPDQQAYVYLRAVDFFANVFGDPDGAIAYA